MLCDIVIHTERIQIFPIQHNTLLINDSIFFILFNCFKC